METLEHKALGLLLRASSREMSSQSSSKTVIASFNTFAGTATRTATCKHKVYVLCKVADCKTFVKIFSSVHACVKFFGPYLPPPTL